MNSIISSLCIVFMTALSAVGAQHKLPQDFPLCHRSDPKVNECLKNAIQASLLILGREGIPAINLPKIEPMKIKSVIVDTNGATSSFNLQSSFKDAEIHGLSTSRVIKSINKFGSKKVSLKAEAYTDRMDFAGSYKMRGQILILPVFGHGYGNVSFHNLTTRHELLGELYAGKNNETFLRFQSYKIKFIPKKVTYRFDNLFNGDPTLSSTLMRFLNENWQPVFEGLIPGYEENFGNKFKDISNILFSQIPYNSVFLE